MEGKFERYKKQLQQEWTKLRRGSERRTSSVLSETRN